MTVLFADGICGRAMSRGREAYRRRKKTRPSSRPPFSPPPTVRRRFSLPKIGRKRLLLPLILIVFALIFNGVFWLKSLTVSLSDETAVMGVIREESNSTFYRRGEKLDYEAVVPDIRAIDAFLASGTSYRMIGEFVYGYKDGGGNLANNFTASAQANVEMFWNSETGMYKFAVSNSGSGTDELLKGYMVTDGTYYIVTENGKIYVLSELYGERTVTDISVDAGVYNILVSYFTENLINTGLINKEVTVHHLWDGVLYNRAIILDNPSFLAFPNMRTELKTYQNRPVNYVYRNKDDDSDIRVQF